jgi:hypothetical protein
MLCRNARAFLASGLCVLLSHAGPLQAQTPTAIGASPLTFAPAAGVEMGTRDAEGRLVVRAMRLPEKVAFDGQLNERMYADFTPAGGFVQAEPAYGAAATEKTDLWVFFDEQAVYVGMRCWDSDPSQWVGLDMRRDSPGFGMNESVTIAFDTFHDKRNALGFGANPVGALFDTATTNERDNNRDWNAVWDARSARFDGGWSVEMRIPFKALRYDPGEQTWGVNIRRTVKWKNEMSYLSQVPQSQNPVAGLQRMSSAATLVGLTSPPESPLLELKPYGITSLKTDRARGIANDPDGDLGIDAKYGLTKSLTADFTYNTDFAQVEDDEQQVNLTRFSLFFPEKRDFFLEGQGIFLFGGYTLRRMSNPGDLPLPFFSRRIGLNDAGQAVPIAGGARVTGRAGAYSLGAVNIQTRRDSATGELPTNFSVLRVRRDILRRSNVGVILTNRSANGLLNRSNQTYGVDGAFTFYENLNFSAYLARTQTPGMKGDDGSYRVQLDYNADRYGVLLERLAVGQNFNPESGYARRHDFRRNLGDFRYSIRPRDSRTIRRFDLTGKLDRSTRSSTGLLETRDVEGGFAVELQNSDRLALQVTDSYDRLPESFSVFGQVRIPIGEYRFRNFHAEYLLGTQYRASGLVAYDQGGFYGGTKRTIALSTSKIVLTDVFTLEPGISLNWVDVPQGAFVAKVVTNRLIYTLTPRTFISGLVQYNSSTNSLSVNARLRWEYRPGSDLFIVYSDGRDTLARGYPALQTRALTVKVTRFFRL